MIITVLVIAVFCLGVGLLVLGANPRRFANQVFATTSVFAAGWLGCVIEAIRVGHQFQIDGFSSPIGWLRANGAITAFFPWLTFVLVDAVSGEHSRGKMLGRSVPLLLLGGVCSAICFSDTFIPLASTPAHHLRGAAYGILCTAGIAVFVWLIAFTYHRMRRQTGLRRVEMEFLCLNLAVTFPATIAITALGNALDVTELKYASFFVLLASFALSGWALTFHRIYDARQIVLSLSQRLLMMLGLAGAIWAGSRLLLESLPRPANLWLAVLICCPIAFWVDRQSRGWLDLGGQRRLARLRTAITNLARTEPNLDQLVLEFERLIRIHSGATFAALLADRGAVFARGRLEFAKGRPAFTALTESGWATPESLDRRRATAGTTELLQYLAQHSLGLMIAVPSGSPNPSLVVALGINRTRWPFTYPEVQRIQEIAIAVDHILVRSRLTADEALKAKLDHLAMMSRGLAHDLKNLITPISSFLVHTHGRYAPESAEAEVHAAARRSVAIITEYISESLFFSNQLTPRFEAVVIADILAIVTEITSPRANRRGIAVVASSTTCDSFDGDMVLVQRMLVNLVNNAIDASIAGANVTLIADAPTADSIRFQVQDDGVGIPAEHTGRVFEPYFTTKQFGDEIRGFGLGLTICEKIVALHGGRISLESSVGVGTTVTIDLPKRQRENAASARRARGAKHEAPVAPAAGVA